jgi:hypothetical protein
MVKLSARRDLLRRGWRSGSLADAGWSSCPRVVTCCVVVGDPALCGRRMVKLSARRDLLHRDLLPPIVADVAALPDARQSAATRCRKRSRMR